MPRLFKGKSNFSANCGGILGYPYMREWNSTHLSYHTQKLTQNSENLNKRSKTTDSGKETAEYLWPGFGSGFSDTKNKSKKV